MPPATDDVIAALAALSAEIEACTGCDLHETRTRAVPGEGDPASDLMFVGEAPGYHEDQQGRPFVGQAGKLLEQLLATIGLTREQVFIANVLKSRPPNNRDPRLDEIAACQPYLWRQIELIRPKVICTLGNHATKLLTGDPAGITRVHGRPQATEVGGVRLYLYPIFHPAAALYTPAMLTTLKEDFLRLPELLTHAAPGAEPSAADRPAWRPPERRPEPAAADGPSQPELTPAQDLTPADDVAPAEDVAPALDVTGRSADEAASVEAASVDAASVDAADPPASDPPAADPPAPAAPGKAEQLGLF